MFMSAEFLSCAPDNIAITVSAPRQRIVPPNMPLPIPTLDDRTFDQLVDEAKALIPKHFPAWTDHNFSDPGIAFLELFAFLIENAIYQINRVPDRSLEHFASLLGVARTTERTHRDAVSASPREIGCA